MEALTVDPLALCHRHSAERPTVVRALHVNDVLVTNDHPGHLDRRLDGLGTRVPEKERVERAVGHQRQETLDERKVGHREADAALCAQTGKSERNHGISCRRGSG